MSLKLTIDETDTTLKKVRGRYSGWKAFCVLRRYLEGDLDLQQANALLYDMLPTKEEKHLAGQPSMFLCVLLDIARQIPYAHPAQLHLLQLVKRLERSDRLTFLVNDYDEGYSFHTSMINSNATIREWYPWMSVFDGPGDGVNMCAFVARLSANGIVDEISFPIWDMRAIFEDDLDSKYYSEYVIGAAMWILCAGQWVFTEMVHVPRSPAEITTEAHVWKNGPLYTGPILGLERWKFWQKGFFAAAESERTTEECKRISLKAANIMNTLTESNHW